MKKHLLISITFLCVLNLSAQNPPVAVNDTATTISEQTVSIFVLQNDYDPDGDDIKIRTVREARHGSSSHNDSVVFYTPDTYTGVDSMKYKIMETQNHSSHSEYAWIYVNILENPNIPDAVADTVSVIKLVPTILNLLENDTDPDSDELLIYDIQKIGFPDCYDIQIADDSLSVIFTSSYPLDIDSYEFKYRVIEKNTPGHYYSDWDTVFVSAIDNPDIPVANDDNDTAVGGIAKTFMCWKTICMIQVKTL